MTNQSLVVRKPSLKAVLSTVIAVLLIVLTFASTAFAANYKSYNVNVVVDSEAFTVTTTETEPIEILKNAGITIASKDKLNVSAFKSGVGGKIVVQKLKTINVQKGKYIYEHKVYSSTVGAALSEAKVSIPKNYKANYEFSSKVKDGMIIAIKQKFNVSLTVDGKTKNYTVIEGTVSDLLKKAGVKLDESDYTKPSKNTALKAGLKVEVFRVEYKNVTKKVVVKYATKKQNDNTLTVGTTKTVQKGQNGSKQVTYKLKYVNGKQNDKKVVNEKVIVKKKDEIVKVGTKEAGVKPNGVQSKMGITLGEEINGRYTHYCACAVCNGNSNGITSSGRKIYNGMPEPYYIACNWLPMGSVIKVDGKNYTVVDRGGSNLSQKGRIDIFTTQGHAACYRLGTGNCKIKVIRLGW